MGGIKLNGFVLLLAISESLAGLNVMNAISNVLMRPLEKTINDTKDFMQYAAENGYNAEKHEVTTDDGYILTMFRIPPGRNCPKKTPMLMMHGLLLTSDCFLASGPEAPAFVLAQDCHDLWFGNVRGNIYSRRHVTLNPDKDLEFWKFSIDEMGLHDLPAMVDYVLDATNTEKLIYLGYSQGGGAFIIMNSEKPKYAEKISLFIGLAPATRLYHLRSVVRLALNAVNSMERPLEAAGVWEVLSHGFPVQGLMSSLCEVDMLKAIVCSSAVAVLESPHPGSITPDTAKRIFQGMPAGTSTQNLARYGQAANEMKFVKFDYGSQDNLEVYGSSEPPEYDFGASTMPAVVFYGKEDHFVDTKDTVWAAEQLPNLLELVLVDDPQWTHFDMAYSRYWRDSIFTKMKKYLDKYNDINNYKYNDKSNEVTNDDVL